jgi:hypothetical protein
MATQVASKVPSPIPPLVQVGVASFGGLDIRVDLEHIVESAFGHHQTLPVSGHPISGNQDAQPLADEVIWNLVRPVQPVRDCVLLLSN